MSTIIWKLSVDLSRKKHLQMISKFFTSPIMRIVYKTETAVFMVFEQQ